MKIAPRHPASVWQVKSARTFDSAVVSDREMPSASLFVAGTHLLNKSIGTCTKANREDIRACL
jgi:hypothetical protein